MRHMLTDRGWYKNMGQVCHSVLRCVFSRSTCSMISLLMSCFILRHHLFLLHGTADPTTPFTRAASATNEPRHPPEQSCTMPLISFIPRFSSVWKEKKDTAATIGLTASHSHCLTYSLFRYPSSFIPLSTCSAEQCRAGGQGGGSWQGR